MTGTICNCHLGYYTAAIRPPCPTHCLKTCPACDGLGYVLTFIGVDRAAVYEPCLCQPLPPHEK